MPTHAPAARCLTLLVALTLGACGGGSGAAAPITPAEFQPDPMFGSGGFVTGEGVEAHTRYDYADVVNDGSMAFVGRNDASAGTFSNILVEKRLPNGSPDMTFGGDGQVQFGTASYTPKDVVLNQSDGSVLVLADKLSIGYVILKVKANGFLDATFGTGGVVQATTLTYAKLAGMIVETNGSIVVAGYTAGVSFIMRYLANGAPDPAWNGGAPYTFQIFGSLSYIEALGRRSGGGFLVAGRTSEPIDDDKLFVGFFGSSGLPVPGFGSAGFLIYTPPSSPNVGGIVTRPGGASVVFGRTVSNAAFALGVSATGGVEPGFGYNELAAPVLIGSLGSTSEKSDGKITLGYRAPGGAFTLWTLLTNGDSDPDFGVNGVSVIPIPPEFIYARIQPHLLGGFLLLGYRSLLPSGAEGVALRLLEN